MFSANGVISKSEDLTMKNIYGKQRLMVTSVSELPEQFRPLLKKLLLKVIKRGKFSCPSLSVLNNQIYTISS